MTFSRSSKLYIIGNGFDLMHDMKTSYADFRNWLLRVGRMDIIEEFQSVYRIKEADNYILWSDFERALGEYDVNVALEWSYENLYLTEIGIGGQLFTSPDFFLNTQLDDIVNEVFPKWVHQIDVSKHHPMLSLDNDALFFSFNYTDTLERLYSIPCSRVCHIHGRAVNNEHLTVGHNNYKDPSVYWDDNKGLRENNERMQRITDMNDLCKPIPKLLEKAAPFFDKLKNVATIEVIGHSCSEIDFPYFKKIQECCMPDAEWLFNPYSEKDKRNVQQLKTTLGL